MFTATFTFETTREQYDMYKVLHAGMCFRVTNVNEDNVWTVQASDHYALVTQTPSLIMIQCESDTPFEDEEALHDFWWNFFNFEDAGFDIRTVLPDTKLVHKIAEYGAGLHIIKQDPWEALVSFIISQRNNIHNIGLSIERLCQAHGKQVCRTHKGFPSPQSLIMPEALASAHLGFRDSYIRSAAYMVATGNLNLANLTAARCSYNNARLELMHLNGIGPKVADCVCLFGLGHTTAFPIDVHIERILQHPDLCRFDVTQCGNHTGLVQQYMFYYAITHNF